MLLRVPAVAKQRYVELVRGIELGTDEREARVLLPSVLVALDTKSFR